MQLDPEIARYVVANIARDHLLNATDAARMFKVGLTKFDQLRKTLDLGEVRLGRSVRYKMSAIQQAIAKL